VHTIITCAPVSPELHDTLKHLNSQVCSGITPAGLAWYVLCRKLLQGMRSEGRQNRSSQRGFLGPLSRILSRYKISRPHETANLLLFLYEGRARVFAFDATTHLILSRNISNRFAGHELHEEHEMLSWLGTILQESLMFIDQKTRSPMRITIVADPDLLQICEALPRSPSVQSLDLLSPAKVAQDIGLQPCENLEKLLLLITPESRLPRLFTSMALQANFMLHHIRRKLGLACALIPGLVIGTSTIHHHILEMQSRCQQIANEAQTLCIKNRSQDSSLAFVYKILRNTDPRYSWQSLCHVPARLVRTWHWQWSITSPLHLATSKLELAVSSEDELKEAHAILGQYGISAELSEPPPFLDARQAMQSDSLMHQQKAVLTLRGDLRPSTRLEP